MRGHARLVRSLGEPEQLQRQAVRARTRIGELVQNVHVMAPGHLLADRHRAPSPCFDDQCILAQKLLALVAPEDGDEAAIRRRHCDRAELARCRFIEPQVGRQEQGVTQRVGLLVLSWARRLGATVIGTVSSEGRARVAREYGCAHPIISAEHRFADVVVDGIGDAARDENFAALARRGPWISLGRASGTLQPIATEQLVTKSITFSRPAVFDYVATHASLVERAGRVWAALGDGTLKAPPLERHSLGAADEAHARLESRRTIGALVLVA